MKTFKEIFLRFTRAITALSLCYGFLTVCNWSYNAGEWNGFSRVLLGFVGVLALIILLSEEGNGE